MPMLHSGAALFAGTTEEFVNMAPASSLTAHLTREFNRRWGTVSASEVRSWKNSLTALAEVVRQAGLQHGGVGVELKLPLTNKRLDASFVARDPEKGSPQVVLVELKQWETAAPSINPDNVLVGGRELLHPSVQAAAYGSYLRESHSAFTEDHFGLAPCAYLHNMKASDAHGLRGLAFEGAVRDAPFFTGDQAADLGKFLSTRLAGGDGMDLLPHLVEGRYSPSKKLIDGIARSLRESPVWTLLDEQRVAFNIVRGYAERASRGNEKRTLIVVGGPGTGKSVIAAHLLVTLAHDGQRSVVHATGSKAFTTNLRALGPAGSDAVFRYFNNFRELVTPPNSIDLVVCDEAHRLRESSNDRFTKAAVRSTISQIREIIRATKVSVFFLDERQNVRPGEIGTVEAIREGAASEGVAVEVVELNGQFRCAGCEGYIEWVNDLMGPSPSLAGAWLPAHEYDLRVFDSPEALETVVRAAQSDGDTARLVAGFCWPWSDPEADGTLVDDVVIGKWQRPWNEKSPEQQKPPRSQPRPSRHPYTLWANEPKRIGEIGCIYSAQGFEFDYVGVILGNDLVWREGVGWVGSRDASFDPSIRRRKLPQDGLVALLQQTYRVLLTRGMKGTFVYSTDFETRQKLHQLVESGAAAAPSHPS
jgi:DUF2075 family protein